MIIVRVDPATKPVVASQRKLSEESALVGTHCLACDLRFIVGDYVSLVLIGRPRGHDWNARAVAVHRECTGHEVT
jgi:hypothetical protein